MIQSHQAVVCLFCGMSEQGRVGKPQEDFTEKEKPGAESRHSRKGEAHAQRLEDENGVEGMRMGRSQLGSEGGLTAAQGKGEGRLSCQNNEN